MDMKPDEIVVRYRQAKHKGEQLKILADLNACTVDEIINVLCEHGGYKPQFFNKAKTKLRKMESAPEPIPVPDVGASSARPNDTKTVDSALDVLRAEIAEINRQQYALDMRKAEIYQKINNALGVMM